MDVKDVGSSQGESAVNHSVGTGEPEAFPSPRDVPVEKLDRSEEEARVASPKPVQNETVFDCAVFCHLWIREKG